MGQSSASRRGRQKRGSARKGGENMTKKYQKPASTGREYVDAARERS